MSRRRSETTSEVLERIAAVLENLRETRNSELEEYQGLKEFKKNSPPQFIGDYDPEGAQRWLQELEKIFRTMLCTDAQKVMFATYMLTGEAENWWNYTRQQLEAEQRGLSWEIFKERFLEKYFPEDVRRRKEIEFLELKQGNMSVGEYAAKFEELSKYFPYYQHEKDERSKCIRFENGLRPDIKPAISYQEIHHFPTLVNKCRIYEGDINSGRVDQKDTLFQEKYSSPEEEEDIRLPQVDQRGTWLRTQVDQRGTWLRKKDNIRKEKEKLPQGTKRSEERTKKSGARTEKSGVGKSSQPTRAIKKSIPRKPRSFLAVNHLKIVPSQSETYKRPHIGSNCPSQSGIKCYSCGKLGHYRNKCPEVKKRPTNVHSDQFQPKRSRF